MFSLVNKVIPFHFSYHM